MILNTKKFNKKIGDNDDLKVLCEQYENIKFHISSKSIRKLKKTIKQNNVIYKPNGLWFGIGCVWFDFLIDQMGYDPCCYIYQVITNDKVKKIKSVEEMNDFGNEIINGNNVRVYIDKKTQKVDPDFDFDSENEKFLELPKYSSRSYFDMAWGVTINWSIVAQKYNGIEVDVKTDKWSKDGRLHNQWFITWDIPSGTIWKFDNDIIKLIFHKKNNIWYQVNDIIQNVKYEFTKK